MKSTSIVLGLIMTSALVQGCGKSDATKNYKNLSLVSPYKDNSGTQKFLSEVMTISLVTDDGTQKVPMFLEGEANEVKLKLDVLDPAITSAAIAFDGEIPKGSTLTQSKTDSSVYIFSWSPPTGFVGSSTVLPTSVNFVAHVLAGPSITANLVKKYTLSLLVERTQVRPKIVSIDIPQVINEGADQVFYVRVQDTAHNAVNQPDVQIVSYQGERNDENHKFDWASKVVPNQPLVSGPDKDGVFTFSYTMSLKGQTLPIPPVESNIKKQDTNASIVNLCFSAVASSKISGLTSDGTSDQCTRVQFANQPPVAYFEGDPDNVIGSNDAVAGQAFSLNFEVKTPNGRGDIQLPQVNFGNLPSDVKPTFVEIANPKDPKAVVAPSGTASSDRFYKITWTPSCKATGSYTFKVHLANSLDGAKKTSDLTRKINVNSKASTCDSPNTANASAKNVKK